MKNTINSIISFFLRHSFISILISAALAALPLNFDSLWPLSWVAVIPLFFALDSSPKLKASLKTGFLYEFLYHAFIYWWFIALWPLDFAGFGKFESAFIVLVAWLGVSLIQAAVLCLAAPLYTLLSKRCGYILKALLFSALHTLLESLTDIGELAFPWSRIGLAQYKCLPILQLSSLGGPLLISFLCIFCGCMIAAIALDVRSGKNIKAELITLFSVAIICLSIGTSLLLSPIEEGETLDTTIIQGNVLVGDKWTSADTLSIYKNLTLEAPASELYVWPESAVSKNMDLNPLLGEYYKKLSLSLKTPIFMGCLKQSGTYTQNAALLVDGESISVPYIKQALVPFGEFLPCKSILSLIPALKNFNLDNGNYIAGESGQLIEYNQITIAPLICFDSIHPALAAEECADGGELIMLVTNDSWYKDYPAVSQHLAAAAFRAAENGKYLVRAANSGISAFISPKGEIISSLGALRKGTLSGTVAAVEATTLYSKTGDIPVICGFLLIVITAVIRKIRYRNK